MRGSSAACSCSKNSRLQRRTAPSLAGSSTPSRSGDSDEYIRRRAVCSIMNRTVGLPRRYPVCRMVTSRSAGRVREPATWTGPGTSETSHCARDSAHLVVRGLLRDLHVVRVALPQTGAADLHEAGLRAQLLDRGDATVTHPGAQSADQLEHRRGQRALERHPALDALG